MSHEEAIYWFLRVVMSLVYNMVYGLNVDKDDVFGSIIIILLSIFFAPLLALYMVCSCIVKVFYYTSHR